MIVKCKKTGEGLATGPNEWCVCPSASECREAAAPTFTPEGLPEGPWTVENDDGLNVLPGYRIVDGLGYPIAIAPKESFARAIASIPARLAENKQFRSECERLGHRNIALREENYALNEMLDAEKKAAGEASQELRATIDRLRASTAVSEVERLKAERDQFAEQAALRDQRDADMQQIMEINNRLRASNAELRETLQHIHDRYVSLIESGDCGFWDPNEDDDVLKMRAVLAKGEPS